MKNNEVQNSDHLAENDDRFHRLVAEYIDLLNRGDMLDKERIVSDHPDVGHRILESLELFQAVGNSTGAQPGIGTLGDYTLREQVGCGGMGVVYDAWENSLDRRVALKVLPPGIAADARSSTRFLREAQIVAKLNHPQIVPVHSTGIKDGTPWYAMEYIEGETLGQVLGRIRDAEPGTETPFGAKDDVGYFHHLARAFGGVADGLQHAHARGVIHRDIKPSNLILDSEAHLRILDFGLARVEGQESLTRSGDFVGTPIYMSPEQARGKKIRVDHRTDLYSLGATMYEALCGRPPFRGKDHSDTLSQIIDRDPIPCARANPLVPRDLETIVLKCLRKEPGDRYGTAEALAQDLGRFVRGDPVEARPQSKLERVARRARRYRGRLVGAGLVLTVLLLLGGLLWRSVERARELARGSYAQEVLTAVNSIRMGEQTIKASAGKQVAVGTHDTHLYVPFLTSGDLSVLGRESVLEHVGAAVEDLSRLASEVPERVEAHYYRAWGLALLGREPEAIKAIDRALGCDDEFVPARTLRDELGGGDRLRLAPERTYGGWQDHWLAARDAMAHARWSKAEATFGGLIEWVKTHGEPYTGSSVEFFLGRGKARLRKADFPGAIRDLATARGGREPHLEPALLLGKAYLLSEREDEAERYFRELYDLADSRSEVALWIAALYRSLRRDEKGLEWAERIETPVLRERLRTVFLIHLCQFEKAVAASRRAVQLDPDGITAKCLLGLALVSHGFHGGIPQREALTAELAGVAEQILASAPESLWGLIFLASAKRDTTVCERMLTLYPEGALAHAGAAHVLLQNGENEAARSHAQRAVKLDPELTWARLMLGYSLRKLNRVKESLAEFDACIRLEPRFVWAWTGKGRALYRLGRFAEADAAFRRGFVLQPYNPPRRYDHGLTLESLGRRRDAVKAYCTAFAQASRRKISMDRRFCNFLLLYEDSFAADELEGLLDTLEKYDAPKKTPERLNTLALLSVAAPEGRHTERALDYVTRALEQSRRPEILATLARVQFAKGEGAAAVRTLEEALSMPRAPRALPNMLARYRRELRLPPSATVTAPPTGDEDDARWLRQQLESGEGVSINCGGNDDTLADGKSWGADRFHRGGVPAREEFEGEVLATKSPTIYRKSRLFPREELGGYTFPLPRGTYQVTLHFAETWFQGPGARLFDVVIEGATRLRGHDPYEEGFATAHSRPFVVEVEDGTLDIDFAPGVDDPFVSAIEIVASKN